MKYKLKNLLVEKNGYIRGPFGSALKRGEMRREGIPVYEQNNIIKNHRIFRYFIDNNKFATLKRFAVKHNDILISCSGTVGEVTKIEKNDPLGIISQAVLILRPNIDIVLPDYLKYFFKSREGHNSIVSRSSGSVQVNIAKREIIENIEIEIPSLNEQKIIVDILNSIDSKIIINRKIIENIEGQAKCLFQKWFLDFEFPNEQGRPYKSSGGKMVESELGMIPYSWEYRELDEISNVKIGRTPPRKEAEWFTDNSVGVKWVSIKDMGNSIGPYIFESSENLTYEAVTKFKINIVPENTLIMSFKLTVGRLNITDERLATNEAIASFEFKDPDLFTEYLYLYLSNFDFNSLGNTSSIGTAVNSKVVKKIKVLIPDSQILQALKKEIIPLFELIKLKTKEINTLNSLRNILLPKLLSGEIELPIKENVEN